MGSHKPDVQGQKRLHTAFSFLVLENETSQKKEMIFCPKMAKQVINHTRETSVQASRTGENEMKLQAKASC